jgi:uncharacterized protein (TIGR02996 family)
MREQFLKAIAEEPYESLHRWGFADWLEENGHDDEARVQRAWTPERHREAEAFMKEYAAMLSGRDDAYDEDDEGRYRTFTVDELLAEATEELAGRGGHVSLQFQTPDEVWTQREEFWRHYSVLTGRPVEEGYDATFVSCGC